MREKTTMFLLRRPVLTLFLMFILAITSISGAIFTAEWMESETPKLSVLQAIFTGASVVTDTGLTVVDTRELSFVSQAIVLIGLQVGALMIMIGAVFVFYMAKNRRLLYRGGAAAAGLFLGQRWKNVKFILVYVLFIEAVGAFLLFWHFKETMEIRSAAWYAVFHSISAFCNAGFYLFSDGFQSFRGDSYVLGVSMGESILGGIGFLVIISVKSHFLRFYPIKSFVVLHKKITLPVSIPNLLKRRRVYGWPIHVKISLITTFLLFILGFGAFFALETANSLAGLSLKEQGLVSLFQSVNARTTGFSALDMGSALPSTQFLFAALMFIGGGTMSVAGGIKVTTLAIFILMLHARIHGRREIVLAGWKRTIPQGTISRANGVFALSFAIVFSFVFVMLVVEKGTLKDVLFEAVSAFGTVGLSTGITAELTAAGKMLIAALMLMGRLGPLILTYKLGQEILQDRAMYLEEEVDVG